MGQLEQVAVVIPIYKENLDASEVTSLKQCCKVLAKYKIFLVAPFGLNCAEYFKYDCQLIVENFPKFFFEGIDGYNSLMLHVDFYSRFRNFTYILIYQLDAFVFRDELQYWCSQGYDYIGAPWLTDEIYGWVNLFPSWQRYYFKLFRDPLKLKRVGNGGFSLRKVKTFCSVLHLNRFFTSRWKAFEDLYWSYNAPFVNPFFKIPSLDIAIRFSFETKPEEAFRKNGYQLPFGCHAWQKYNPTFWSQFITE